MSHQPCRRHPCSAQPVEFPEDVAGDYERRRWLLGQKVTCPTQGRLDSLQHRGERWTRVRGDEQLSVEQVFCLSEHVLGEEGGALAARRCALREFGRGDERFNDPFGVVPRGFGLLGLEL